MITIFENFKIKDYEIICVKTVGKEESFDAQKLFFKYGFKWDVPGEEFELFQVTSTDDSEVFFYILLDEKEIMYELWSVGNYYYSKKNRPNKIFDFKEDKREIELILKIRGAFKPSYLPKKISR